MTSAESPVPQPELDTEILEIQDAEQAFLDFVTPIHLGECHERHSNVAIDELHAI
jgi:hypothetical protein